MKITDVRKYQNELVALLTEHEKAQSAVDQITALMRAADAAGERQQQLQLQNQRQAYERQESVLAKAIEAHARADTEGARTLATDLSVRIDAAQKAFDVLRGMLAEFEFKVESGEFVPEPPEGEAPTGFTRAMAEAQLDQARARVDKRVELAVRAVPDRPVVLL